MKLRIVQKPTKIIKILGLKKLVAAIIVVIVVLPVLTRGARDNRKIQTVTVKKDSIRSEVVASGTIQASQITNLRFLTSGKISYINVQKGQHVRKGQILAELDTQELEKKLQQDLNRYFKTRLDFDETKESQEDKIITDSLKRIAQKSQADLDNSVIDVEIRDLAIQFSKLISPIEGYIVENQVFFVGSHVSSADTITQVANLSTIQFVTEVDETDISKVRLGQKAKITLDASLEKSIEAEADLIAPRSITTSTGATAFEVIFNLPHNKDYLLGMNGTANIEIEKKEGVIVVPQEVVIDEKYVWVKEDKNYQRKEIQKGLESDIEIEVVSGLDEEAEIVTNGFEQLQKQSLLQKIIKIIT